MSEPLTSHEIEDVLSSIRRLVSEDLRPATRSVGPAMPPGSGKLVLTQALRVVPGGDDLAAPAAFADLAPQDGGIAACDDAPGAVAMAADEMLVSLPDEFIAGEDEVIWATAGSLEPLGLDTMSANDPAPPVAAEPEAFRRGHWTVETVPRADWIQSDEDWVDEAPVPFAAHRRATLTEDPLARAWADRAEAEVRAEIAALDASPGDDDPATGYAAGYVVDGLAVPDPMAAGPASDDTAAMAWAEPEQVLAAAAEPADAAPAREAAPEAAPAARAPGLFDGEESLIDEEVLRDIVREIIREELAGTLGERITRNVRKLVRVEINRALTAREFE